MRRISMRMASVVVVGLVLLFTYAGRAEANWQYTVQPGDTFYLIGQRVGVSAADIKSANGLWSDDLLPGQVLTIPSGGNSAGNSGVGTYRVQKGDTLYTIAQKNGTTVQAIRRYNNFWHDVVYPGQVLKIPAQNVQASAVTVSRGASRRDLELLARAVYSEARGEIYEGQVAVAAVILNRLKHPDFPKSIAGIIYEPGAFSAVDDGQINLQPDATAYKAAQDALNGWDPTGGALYYWNPATATSSWVWSRPITVQIGNHVFAK